MKRKLLPRKALALAAILICLSWLTCGCIDDQPSVPIGQQGRLMVQGGSLVAVAATEDAFDKWQKARGANDNYGQFHLMQAGLIFTVNNGTRVLVIDYGALGVRKIRILEGGMQGRAGYVPREYISP